MKIPKEVKGLHKIRDSYILKLYLNDNLTLAEVGLKVGLSAPRCQQIIYANRHLINWDKAHEKAIRINSLKRLLQKHPQHLNKKSTIDILEQLRKEIEGEKSFEQHILIDKRTFVYLDPKAKEEETGKDSGKNRIISQLPTE